jgi:predicted amidohydrolase
MSTWRIAGVQMDVRLGDKAANLAAIRSRLAEAAKRGARLVIFPECSLTGYGFENLTEAAPFAEPLPGPTTAALAEDCRRLNVFAAVGMLESAPAPLSPASGERGRGEGVSRVFNACALVGPSGFIAGYRKAHLPILGVDRFTTPGDRPFAVHDLGGLKVGMTICYDGSFPEASRVLMLLGADLVILPTNWPTGAVTTVCHLVQARALENHIYFAAVNRVGEERGFRFIGQSRIVAPNADLLASAGEHGEEIIVAEIDPAVARNKHIVKVAGKYELDRVADRRPDLYGPLCEGK